MSGLDPVTRTALAEGVMRHLEFHTAYLEPGTTYQFALPDGRFLTLADYLIKRSRVLWFFGRAPANPYRKVSAVLSRPRGLPREGAWFVGYTDRQRRKALSRIEYAVGFSYGSSLGGADTQREPAMVLIDPLGPLERVPAQRGPDGNGGA